MKLKVVQISLFVSGLAVMLVSYLSGGAGEAGIDSPKVFIPMAIFGLIPVSWIVYKVAGWKKRDSENGRI